MMRFLFPANCILCKGDQKRKNTNNKQTKQNNKQKTTKDKAQNLFLMLAKYYIWHMSKVIKFLIESTVFIFHNIKVKYFCIFPMHFSAITQPLKIFLFM